MHKKLLTPLLSTLLLAAAPAFAADYVQAPRAALAFAGKYQGKVFTGTFPGFRTTMRFDPQDLANARLDVAIPIATASTGNRDYDGEMRGKAFLDAAGFPQARYTATTFRALGGDRYAADGSLTLRGIAKPVTLEFTWTPGPRPLLVGKATVHRLRFDVGGGDWADTKLLPDAIAVATKLELQPAP